VTGGSGREGALPERFQCPVLDRLQSNQSISRGGKFSLYLTAFIKTTLDSPQFVSSCFSPAVVDRTAAHAHAYNTHFNHSISPALQGNGELRFGLDLPHSLFGTGCHESDHYAILGTAGRTPGIRET
jgi:hypothetical protein